MTNFVDAEFERQHRREIARLTGIARSRPERFQWRVDDRNPLTVLVMLFGRPDGADPMICTARSAPAARAIVIDHNLRLSKRDNRERTRS